MAELLCEEELKQAMIEKRSRAAKKGLVFEISEELPDNWQLSIPIVLQTLDQLQ